MLLFGMRFLMCLLTHRPGACCTSQSIISMLSSGGSLPSTSQHVCQNIPNNVQCILKSAYRNLQPCFTNRRFVNKAFDLSMNLIQEANQLQIDLQTGLQTGHKLPISLAQKLIYQTGQCQFVLCR